MIKLKNLITEGNDDIIKKFISILPKYDLEYHSPEESKDAFHWRGNVYPTVTNKDKTVKVALDRTDIFNRNGNVWVGDSSRPLVNGYVIQCITTNPEDRGKGKAKEILQKITKAADESGLLLKLEPVPMKDFISKKQKGLTKPQLLKWYSKHGFTSNDTKNIMTRNPVIKEDYFNRERNPEERERQIQNWLDDRIKNAPGKDRGEKLQWLWGNDRQFAKVAEIFLKMIRSLRPHPKLYVKDAQRYYIRFGNIPKSGKSKNYLYGYNEKGVSAYSVKWDTRKNKWKIDENDINEGGMASLYELTYDAIHGNKRPIYLIQGIETTDTGGDGEPLLDHDKIKILKKLNPWDFYSDEIGEDWWKEYD